MAVKGQLHDPAVSTQEKKALLLRGWTGFPDDLDVFEEGIHLLPRTGIENNTY